MGKIQWKVIAWQEPILQQSDNGRKYRCWLESRKKSLERFQNKKLRSVSWSIRAKWYITISICIWKLPQQMHGNTWAWPSILFVRTRLAWQAWLKKTEIIGIVGSAFNVHPRWNVLRHTQIHKRSLSGLGDVLAWVTCYRGWRACMGDVLTWMVLVAC